ncbi:MAG: hypothetical protein AB1Z65_17170 [Candidatus Sulfomarinibacteraceae bacterium]
MLHPIRLLCLVLLAGAAAGCDSVDLTIDVAPGSADSLIVSNANAGEWTDARLVVETVESDNSTAPCVERTMATWRPEETITIPACGNKIRLTLTVGSETARFAYANGQLFRRFGRKEVPVAKP